MSLDPTMNRVMQNVDACQTQLKVWSKQSFCTVVNTLTKKKKSLKKAEDAAVKGGSVECKVEFIQLCIGFIPCKICL